MFSIRTEQQDGRQDLAVGHLLDGQQMLVENFFEAVAVPQLGDDVPLAKLECLLQSGQKRHSALPRWNCVADLPQQPSSTKRSIADSNKSELFPIWLRAR